MSDKCERCTTEAAAVFLIAISIFTIVLMSTLHYARARETPRAPTVATICYVHVDETPARTECVPYEA